MVIISTLSLGLIWMGRELERVIEALEGQEGQRTSFVREQEAQAGPGPLLWASPLVLARGTCPSGSFHCVHLQHDCAPALRRVSLSQRLVYRGGKAGG